MQATSLAAQLSLSLDAKATQRQRIYDALASSFGLTDNEIQERLSMDGNTERPRRGELLRSCLIEDSLERRLTATNRKAIVWRVRR